MATGAEIKTVWEYIECEIYALDDDVPLDPASIRLIEARQRSAGWLVHRPRGALGASAPFDALANMKTNTQARGVLGIAAKWLNQGFGILDTFPFLSGEAKTQATDLLNRTNTYAQKVYAKLPDNDAPINPVVRKQVVLATNQAATNLKLVSSVRDNLNQGLLSDLVDYLNSVVHHFIDDTIKHYTDQKKTDITRIAIYVALGTVGLGLLFVTAKLVHTAVLGQAALGEAEDAAVAAAEAEHRRAEQRKSAKQIVSIS